MASKKAPAAKKAAPKKAAVSKAAAPKPTVADEPHVLGPTDPGFTGNIHVDDPTLNDATVQMVALGETEPRIGVPEIHQPTPEAVALGRLADRFP